MPQIVAQHLAKGLPIQYNKKVTNVEYGENEVTVKTSDGGLYRADAVIFTASLGVLKVSQWMLFCILTVMQ